MKRETRGLARSVQTRLVNHARAIESDPNHVLTRYATERFLYRLSKSVYADRFVLKGALLMLAWLGETIRPTRDADLLGFGDMSQQALAEMFREICMVPVDPDGMGFLADSVTVHFIREADAYGGQRVNLTGMLGGARLRVQIDVGVGDLVTPEPEWLVYPALLDFPPPKLRAYRPETSIAEKFQAMVVLGEQNSRMKDFFDIFSLAVRGEFAGETLTSAIRNTFERRRTAFPDRAPLALTEGFAASSQKRAQWRAFVRKSHLTGVPEDFPEVVRQVSGFLGPIVDAARTDAQFSSIWLPGGPWRDMKS